MDLRDNRGPELVGLQVAFLVLAWVAVALRCFVRTCITKAFKTDDWLMLFSLAIFTVSAGFMFTSLHYGLGMHNNALSLDNLTQALKYQALTVNTYIMNMLIIKLSVASFLLHIAVHARYIWAIKTCTLLVTIISLFAFFFTLFRCWPIELQWDDFVPGSCMPGRAFVAVAFSYSIVSIASDWFYALLPIPMIWRVKMNLGTKLSVMLILSLGVVASVATIVRCAYLVVIIGSDDLLYGTVDAMMWTIIEPGLSIMAASMVTLRPLLRALRVPGFRDPASDRYEVSSTVGGTAGVAGGARMGPYAPMGGVESSTAAVGALDMKRGGAINGIKSTTVVRVESMSPTPATSEENILPIRALGYTGQSTVRTTIAGV